MKRETLLNKLILDLAEMIALLGKDPSCRWAKKFESDLIAAKSVALSPIDPNAYASLSASIRSVYGGVGSFNDYVAGCYDPDTGRYTPFEWSDRLDQLSTTVFDGALALVASQTK
ncbi:hypothetical protein P5Y53_08760 [Dyella jiangningensis]|uniref:DUF6966 domain-containing protein n=1 Tax=Dyella jiangningensis TaxID=1379159 RepID=UPI00240F7242|nr:hypothetical protein [Dyella jiangningensis]MDG2537748.1 hypothetical protein [Dyella jiangningensis]